MGWEVVVVAVIIATALMVTVKTWGKEKAAQRAEREALAQRATQCPHIWNQWQADQKGRIVDGGTTVGYYYRQVRDCEMCGQIDLKTTKSKV